eukprot:1144555-Pelagomonas_calceolata.AAC.9
MHPLLFLCVSLAAWNCNHFGIAYLVHFVSLLNHFAAALAQHAQCTLTGAAPREQSSTPSALQLVLWRCFGAAYAQCTSPGTATEGSQARPLHRNGATAALNFQTLPSAPHAFVSSCTHTFWRIVHLFEFALLRSIQLATVLVLHGTRLYPDTEGPCICTPFSISAPVCCWPPQRSSSSTSIVMACKAEVAGGAKCLQSKRLTASLPCFALKLTTETSFPALRRPLCPVEQALAMW